MLMESPRPAKQPTKLRDETLHNECFQNDKTNRNMRFMSQNVRTEREPLLLSSTKNMKPQQGQDSSPLKSGERLTNLHSQLYQQTEKLKQWKINTEMQINDKDRKITEASKTIESLRKSILELQFLNESVSSRLHDEKTLQEETIQKIATTRNMCNALKEHLVKLETGVTTGESMLEKQREHTQSNVNLYEELALRFQELEIKVTSKEHELEKAATEKYNEYKDSIEALQQQLNESKEQATSLRQMNQLNQGEIVEGNQELATAKKGIQTLKEECLYLREEISKANNAIKENEILLQEEKNNNRKLTQECQEKDQKYTVQVTNLESACNEKENEIRIQEKDLLDKCKNLAQAEARLKDLSETIGTKDLEIEELLAKISELESVKIRLEFDINIQTNKSTTLEETIKELEHSVAMHKDIESKLNQIAEDERETAKKLSEEIQVLKEHTGQAEKDRTKINDLNEKVQNLENNKEELQFQANFALSQIEELTSKLQKLIEENQSLVDELEGKSHELQELQTKYAKMEKNLEETEIKMKDKCKDVAMKNDELKGLQSKLEEMSLEKANNQGVLTEVMDARDKKIASSESKIKTLEERLSAKQKQISKLQSDVKTLKGQLKKEEKLTAKQENTIAAAEKQFEKLEKAKIDKVEELQKRETKLLDDLQKMQMLADEKEKQSDAMRTEIERLKNQADISHKQHEKAKEDLVTARQGFDSQITEMCNTLEKYKVENEKLMNAKEKELDMRTNEILSSNKMLEETVRAKDYEIKKLNENLSDKDFKIVQLEQLIKEMTSKVSILEAQFDKKEKSDIEMIESNEKHPNAKQTATKTNEKVNLARKSQPMSNSFMSGFHGTQQISTPSSVSQGIYI